jgi:hypothetical protein
MTDIPTSDTELEAACPGLTVWLYRDIATQRELPRLPIAVLYETEPGFGHWVGVLKTPEGIEHFDSYGYKPDTELQFVPVQYREQFAATAPFLARLLANSGQQINYNEYKLQGPKSNTCGRWVVARCRNHKLTTSQFAEAMTSLAAKKGITLDQSTLLIMPPSAGSGQSQRRSR